MSPDRRRKNGHLRDCDFVYQRSIRCKHQTSNGERTTSDGDDDNANCDDIGIDRYGDDSTLTETGGLWLIGSSSGVGIDLGRYGSWTT
mmetsp:Transcript_22080/g.35541  ORF Transcript_22080/g.35541 Transcript_22080/m.35541 type:complete len:88 (-) Transcript_22080:157-420(-)